MPYEASIQLGGDVLFEWLPGGFTAEVNGQSVTGPRSDLSSESKTSMERSARSVMTKKSNDGPEVRPTLDVSVGKTCKAYVNIGGDLEDPTWVEMQRTSNVNGRKKRHAARAASNPVNASPHRPSPVQFAVKARVYAKRALSRLRHDSLPLREEAESQRKTC